ncbi:MAG: 50S ribosomal protein L24e [Candidatus Aenigmarchaeota archaeon]|nr:50S ribosomal protein L24e [Candidatus Aenigmarchaeota archaeon]
MVNCFFCGKTVKKGIGILYVNNKGQNMHFCSSKCRKYSLMGRKKGKWAIEKE